MANARRASSGTVSFEIDDGSGPLRVVLGASLQAADDHLAGGSWVQVTGVLGQETTGAEPTLGYRVWPRDPDEVRVLAAVTDPSDASTRAGAADADARFGGPDVRPAPADSLAAIGVGSLADLRVGATLVTGAWEELDVAGLLWDGERLVGIDAASGDAARARHRIACPADLARARRPGRRRHARAARRCDRDARRSTRRCRRRREAAGRAALADAGARARRRPGSRSSATCPSPMVGAPLPSAVSTVAVEQLCGRAQAPITGVASVRGIALPDAAHIIVPCDGIGPAPALSLSSGAAGRRRRRLTPEPGARPHPRWAPTAGSDRRWLAVALLAAGVAVLLSVALVRRRLGRQEGGDPMREDLREEEDVPAGRAAHARARAGRARMSVRERA